MMSEIDAETSKVVWLPSTRGLEAEALRVYHWHDRELHIAVWQVGTAGAAVVGALND